MQQRKEHADSEQQCDCVQAHWVTTGNLSTENRPETEQLERQDDGDEGVRRRFEPRRQTNGAEHRHVERNGARDEHRAGAVVVEDEVSEQHEERHGVDRVGADGVREGFERRGEKRGEDQKQDRRFEVFQNYLRRFAVRSRTRDEEVSDVQKETAGNAHAPYQHRRQQAVTHMPPYYSECANCAELL